MGDGGSVVAAGLVDVRDVDGSAVVEGLEVGLRTLADSLIARLVSGGFLVELVEARLAGFLDVGGNGSLSLSLAIGSCFRFRCRRDLRGRSKKSEGESSSSSASSESWDGRTTVG